MNCSTVEVGEEGVQSIGDEVQKCEDTICGKVLAQTVLCLYVSAYQIVELSGIGFKAVLVLMH